MTMSLLDVDVSNAKEPKVLDSGSEVKLRITGVTVDNDKNDEPYMMPRFEIVDEPMAKDFTHFFRLPHDGLDEKQMNRAKWNLKVFYEAFEIDSSHGVETDDLQGATGWAILGVGDNQEYGEQNFIRKFVTPK